MAAEQTKHWLPQHPPQKFMLCCLRPLSRAPSHGPSPPTSWQEAHCPEPTALEEKQGLRRRGEGERRRERAFGGNTQSCASLSSWEGGGVDGQGQNPKTKKQSDKETKQLSNPSPTPGAAGTEAGFRNGHFRGPPAAPSPTAGRLPSSGWVWVASTFAQGPGQARGSGKLQALGVITHQGSSRCRNSVWRSLRQAGVDQALPDTGQQPLCPASGALSVDRLGDTQWHHVERGSSSGHQRVF